MTFGNTTAHIVAKISDAGQVLSVDIYSAGPGSLTQTCRDCNYAQLAEVRGSDFADAYRIAVDYYASFCKLSERFPLERRFPR
jgi:hypothetical protein